MNKLLFLSLGAGIFLLDGLIISGTTGYYLSMLFNIYLVSILIYFGPTKFALISGFVFSVLFELFVGLPVGLLTMSFLLTALLTHILNGLFSIRWASALRTDISDMLQLFVYGFVMVILFTISVWAFSFYFDHKANLISFLSPSFFINSAAGLIFMLLISKFICSKKSTRYL
jgi:hypothetical protein